MKNDTERFYDAVAPGFEASYYGRDADPCIRFDVESFERIMEEAVSDQTGAALEVGCGSGYWLGWLARRGWDVIGVDISDEMCKRARSRGFTAFQADASELPVPEASCDLIISPYCAMDHCERFARAFAELARVAKPGATAVVMLDNAERHIARYWHVDAKNVTSVGSDPREDGKWLHEVDGAQVAVYTKMFSQREVRQLMCQWDLDVFGVGVLTPLVPRWMRTRRLRRAMSGMLRLIAPLEHWLCRSFPSHAALSVYVARRH